MTTRGKLQDGTLSLCDLAQLEEAERAIDPAQVWRLHIGASCYCALPLPALQQRLRRYAQIEELRLADDYIPDREMEAVKRALMRLFARANFSWSHDGAIDGKHGR
jgi:hypothetical protein